MLMSNLLRNNLLRNLLLMKLQKLRATWVNKIPDPSFQSVSA